MLYQPPAFKEDRPEVLHAIIRAARLPLLVSNGADGVPDITHLPLLLDPSHGPQGTLHGHVARANPHWQRLAAVGRATAVFAGAEAYVSPNWYPSKAEHHRVVPTWNYEAVHATGTVTLIEAPEELFTLVSRLSDHHEARTQARPWQLREAPNDFIYAQLRGIVGIALRIETLVGKRKLSQNRAPADRDGAIAGLRASEDARDQAAAAAMARAAEGG